jgi:3-isopropylmalate dehydratase small subunit
LLQERLAAGCPHDRGGWLFHEVAAFPPRLVIDLERQTVATTDGSKVMRFDIDPFRKYCLAMALTT